MDFKPKKQENIKRSKPTDDILKHYKRNLHATELTSTRLKSDTHMAIKQVAILEHKKMYEVIDEAVENYIKQNIPDATERLIVDNIKFIQENMPQN